METCTKQAWRRKLTAYVDRELPPERAAEIEMHLETCARRRREVALDLRIARALHALPAWEAPASVTERAVKVWLDGRDKSDQLAQVMRAILTGGSEIGMTYAAVSKIRRPYERIIAFLRATDSVVNAFDLAVTAASAFASNQRVPLPGSPWSPCGPGSPGGRGSPCGAGLRWDRWCA